MEDRTLDRFLALGVDEDLAATLGRLGITEPFPIQTLAVPLVLRGDDVIGQARTGTGKTLAFGVPLLQRLAAPAGRQPRALVIVPTRELAVQVTADLARFGADRAMRVQSVYGGRAYEPQIAALRDGVDVVVSTPGRLLDLVGQRHLDLGSVSTLVLDEADRMLDLGFLPDVERILRLLPTDRQTMLFSATMPSPIVALARRYMRQPVHVRAEDPSETSMVPTTAQHVLRTHPLDKEELVGRILQAEGRGLTMIFCRTKRQCQRVSDDLTSRGFAVAAVHGDLGQGQREQALRAFRAGKVDVLVATDVAARGIDVGGVTHVINYACPDDEKDYLHRIGRTGRAGESGIAVTFVDWEDLARWRQINDALGLPFAEPPETYSTSPHLYTALAIPANTGSRLPRAQRVRAGLAAEPVDSAGDTGRRGAAADQPDKRSRSTSKATRLAGGRAGGRTGGPAGGRTTTRAGARVDGRPAADDPAAEGADRNGPAATALAPTALAPTRRRRRRRRSGSTGDSGDGGVEAASA